MEVRVLLPQPAFFGSHALIVKPLVLTRQNSEHYRGGPPSGSMAQQTAQLPHKEKVAGANPARAPIFRSVAEQQLRRAVNALPLRATKVRVLPLRPICIQPVESNGLSSLARAGTNPVSPTTFRRVVQSEPSALYAESR